MADPVSDKTVTLTLAQLEQAIAALDTAGGCLMLVADDRKPIDLQECREEIGEAYDMLLALDPSEEEC